MQQLPIPQTKLRPPMLRHPMVPRPRLTEALLDRRALTVISAPAGSGKTTLAVEWVASMPGSVAWLSLDEDDNDPIRFMLEVFAALQVAGIDASNPSSQRNSKTMMAELINELMDMPATTLMLDDYHVIHEPSIHAALAYLLDHIPPSLQMVLLTRELPPLPLSRLRTRGQLVELNLSDLRFTVDETNTFLNQVMRLNLSSEQIHSLERYTQGWIAGLQMAGISLQANKDHTVAQAQEQQFLSEYLLAEIFDQQAKDVQDFLLNTSIVEQFSLSLCKAMMSGNAGKLLTRIQQANLFISQVGAWYQYHPLFREFLQAQLKEKYPERIEGLHCRALAWMEDNGFRENALQHAHAVDDQETYARLVESLAPDYLKRGELVTLRRWLKRLPDAMIWKYPRLCLTQIWLLLDSNLQTDAQSYFDRLGTFLDKKLQSEFLALRALHAAMNHKPDVALKFAKRAQRSTQAKDPFIQTYVAFGMGAAQKMGLNFFQAEQSFRDSLALADADGNTYIAISSLVNLADVLYLQARLHDAEHVCKTALKRFGHTPDARDWHLTLARISFQHNKLDESLAETNRVMELSAEEPVTLARAFLHRALTHHALGERTLARADLNSADQLARGFQDQVILRSILRQQSLFAAQEGDLISAKQWLHTLLIHGEQPFPFFQAYARGRLLYAERRFKGAQAEFQLALKHLQGADFALVRLEVMIWQAACLGALDKTGEGAKILKQAIKAAQTESVIRPFVEARQGLLSLIEKSGRENFPWVLDFLHEMGQKTEGLVLTRREREILQLLAVGLSNQEMAERLFIAEGTLKRHVANVYQKLGVHNRAQAIRQFHLK